jgi:Oxidoreductase family, C-terminal alpha/beta domain
MTEGECRSGRIQTSVSEIGGEVNCGRSRCQLGRTLEFDPETQLVKKDEDANRLLRDAERGYRAPFTVPESV